MGLVSFGESHAMDEDGHAHFEFWPTWFEPPSRGLQMVLSNQAIDLSLAGRAQPSIVLVILALIFLFANKKVKHIRKGKQELIPTPDPQKAICAVLKAAPTNSSKL